MNKDLKHYIKIYDNFLDAKFCTKVIKYLKQQEWHTHQYFNELTKTGTSYDTDLAVFVDQDQEESNYIHQKMWDMIYQYICVDYKEVNEWFNSWSGYSRLRYNKYDKNTEMRMHCDHIHTLFDGDTRGVPILTILGSLNDNYEGGELFLIDEVIELKAGSLMIFPSNFLYPHKVTPVTKGTRYSYVSWVW